VFSARWVVPWHDGFVGHSVGVGSGNGLSEVPVFRDQPAALDLRVAPGCLPGPHLTLIVHEFGVDVRR
jgi:hypothetical protein